MKENGRTFRSLVLSLIATVVCIVMLVSTTFAWYQTSTTSDVNVVRTGDFDVEFEYSDDCENWAVFDSTAKLFNDVTLLPGQDSGVKYIRVTNNNGYAVTASASLIDLEVTDNNTELKFYSKVVEGPATPAELKIETESALTSMDDTTFVDSTPVPAKSGSTPGRVIIALLISLPTSSTSENVQGNFKILLNAVQAHGGQRAPRTVSEDVVTVLIPNAEVQPQYAAVLTGKSVEDNGASVGIAVNKDGSAVPADEGPFTVTVNIGLGRELTAISIAGNPIVDYTYNATTGVLTFDTASLGAFTAAYATDANLQAIAGAGVIAGATVLSADDPALAADPEDDYATGFRPNGKLQFNNAPVSADEYGIHVNMGSMTLEESDVDVIMNFSADQQPGSDLGEYGSYATDFFVSFDRDIPAGAVSMFGGYAGFGWIGFTNTGVPVAAGQQIPMIGLMNATLSYQDVVNSVQSFMCAIHVDFDQLPADVDSVTVSLNLVMIDQNDLTSAEAYMDPSIHNVVFDGEFVIERPAP